MLGPEGIPSGVLAFRSATHESAESDFLARIKTLMNFSSIAGPIVLTSEPNLSEMAGLPPPDRKTPE